MKDLPPNANIDEILNPKKLQGEMAKPFSSRVKLAIEYNE